MKTAGNLRFERRGRVGIVTLNRPDRLNALNAALVAELSDLADDLEGEPTIGAVVVRGEGRAFCAGADIEGLGTFEDSGAFGRFLDAMTGAFERWERLAQPTVAAIDGLALGGGLELALVCDLRVADRSARLGVPEIKLGLLPGAGGCARLPRLVPPGVAAQLLLTGEALNADEALAYGLVNRVVDGDASGKAGELAAQLAQLPASALAAAKRLLRDGPSTTLEAALAMERDEVTGLFDLPDRIEGVSAFREKRPTRFHSGDPTS